MFPGRPLLLPVQLGLDELLYDGVVIVRGTWSQHRGERVLVDRWSRRRLVLDHFQVNCILMVSLPLDLVQSVFNMIQTVFNGLTTFLQTISYSCLNLVSQQTQALERVGLLLRLQLVNSESNDTLVSIMHQFINQEIAAPAP